MPHRKSPLICIAFIIMAADVLAATPESFPLRKAILKAHRLGCHSGPASKGNLNLERLGSDLGDAEVLGRWVRIHDRITNGEMPPKNEARPDPTTSTEFLTTLQKEYRFRRLIHEIVRSSMFGR